MGKRDPRDERRGRARVRWLTSLVVAALALLCVRLFTLQYVQHDHYAQYAEENQLRRDRIVAPRGLIRDRNATVLVDNVPRFSIVIPSNEEHVKRTVDELFAYLPLDTAQIFARFSSWNRRNAGIPFPLIQNADKLEISFVRENYDLFPTLRVEANARRRYRRDTFAAHLLGYVGEASDQFLAQPKHRGYYPGDIVGKTGIEAVCESYLRGEDGQKVVMVNASGTVLEELNELMQAPVPGKDVILTIDAELQAHLESVIGPYTAGAAVVLDVEDGSILAAISLPQFDPNRFAVGINQEEWEELHEAPEKPLFNRFLQATYPPGSTLKVISAYSLLVNRIVDPDEATVYCTGAHRFGNRTFRCWKVGGHGWSNLHDGVIESCDCYFYKAAQVLDVDELAAAAKEFGLGTRTGIDLPNEALGLVPTREYYNNRYGRGQWTQGLVLNNIIGQGEYLAGVLQMARVAAAVANGGYLVQPHVIKQVEGEVTGVYPRRKIRNLSGATLSYLRDAMEAVVESEHGTGRGSRVRGMRVAGKTGTSQNPHGEDHAWFIGFAPARDSEIAVAIVVENAGHGGAVAAPIAAAVYRQYFTFAQPDSVARAQPASHGGDRQ